uniref:Uncharacterized protein n=1 Tax=Janibacter limosus TaxID=53458 RepID=A0AC61U1A7_9MICO|nr:hypothetical protein [Janibacter limosus]
MAQHLRVGVELHEEGEVPRPRRLQPEPVRVQWPDGSHRMGTQPAIWAQAALVASARLCSQSRANRRNAAERVASCAAVTAPDEPRPISAATATVPAGPMTVRALGQGLGQGPVGAQTVVDEITGEVIGPGGAADAVELLDGGEQLTTQVPLELGGLRGLDAVGRHRVGVVLHPVDAQSLRTLRAEGRDRRHEHPAQPGDEDGLAGVDRGVGGDGAAPRQPTDVPGAGQGHEEGRLTRVPPHADLLDEALGVVDIGKCALDRMGECRAAGPRMRDPQGDPDGSRQLGHLTDGSSR